MNRSDDLTFTNLITGTGSLTKSAGNVVSILQPNSYTGTNNIADGGLRISHPGALGESTNLISIGAAQFARLELSNNITLPQTLLLGSKGGALNGPPHVVNAGGTNTLAGPIVGTTGGTDWVLQSDADKLIVSGTFSNATSGSSQALNLRGAAFGEWQASVGDSAAGTATILNKKDAGTWVLARSSSNTYSGVTAISGGTLVVDGAILKSAGVLVNGGATLAGNGLIIAPVTNASTGVLSPGDSLGTLTISNKLTLAAGSVCNFEVSASGHDQVRGLSSVVFEGALEVFVVGDLYGVETFKLFDAAAYSGAFASVNLPPLTAPLAWDTTALETQGILRVTGGIKVEANRSGNGNMQLTGNGPANSGYRVLASTNLVLPLSQWIEVGNGTFATDGSYTFTDANTGSFTQRYYRIVTP